MGDCIVLDSDSDDVQTFRFKDENESFKCTGKLSFEQVIASLSDNCSSEMKENDTISKDICKTEVQPIEEISLLDDEEAVAIEAPWLPTPERPISNSNSLGGPTINVDEDGNCSFSSASDDLLPLGVKLQRKYNINTASEERCDASVEGLSKQDKECVRAAHCISDSEDSLQSESPAEDSPKEEAQPMQVEDEECYTQLKEKPKKGKQEERCRKKVEKELQKEERQRKKEEKEREKVLKAAQREALKSLKPGECLKYITVNIDKVLLETSGAGSLLNALEQLGVSYHVVQMPQERSIIWKRKVVTNNLCQMNSVEETEEDQVLIVLTSDQFLFMVQAFKDWQMSGKSEGTLLEHILMVNNLFPGKKPTYIVIGLEKYFSKEKIRQNREHRANVLGSTAQPVRSRISSYDGPSLTKVDIEEAVIYIQLQQFVNVHYVETASALANLICSFTKAVAEAPYKKDRYEKQETCWYLQASDSDAVKLNKNGEGLLKVWQQQIQQFSLVGPETAQAIVAKYPSPQLLLMAYQKCSNESEAKNLLKDIVVRRGVGPLATTRRIGPELSRKVFKFFTEEDANQYI